MYFVSSNWLKTIGNNSVKTPRKFFGAFNLFHKRNSKLFILSYFYRFLGETLMKVWENLKQLPNLRFLQLFFLLVNIPSC